MDGPYSLARLRRGVLHFLAGKVLSAALSLAALLLLARLLSTADYGRYVALVALVELGLGLASLGLDWVAGRYVPEYRVRASAVRLARFIVQLAGLQALLLALLGLLLWSVAEPLAAWLGLGSQALPAIHLYSLYLFLEGLSRVLRDQMLGHLLLQGRAQLALLVRHGVAVGACVGIWLLEQRADLVLVASIEVGATALGLLLAALGLGLALRAERSEVEGATCTWTEPPLSEMRRLALNSYASLLMSIPTRPQVLMLLVTRLAGAEAAALFGFARALSEQVLRFLPAELLLGFLRPALVARYLEARDFADLNLQTKRLLLVSLMVLAPVLCLALAQGPMVLSVLGGVGFAPAAPLLALLLMGVALLSHRRMLEFIANSVGQPEVIRRASALMWVAPLGAAGLLILHAPLWTVPVPMLLGELLFGWRAGNALRAAGFGYVAPVAGTVRSLVALAAAALPLSLLQVGAQPGVWTLLGVGLMGAALTLCALALVRPLDAASLAALRGLLRKNSGSAHDTAL
ncbi:O-antigen/teichoic acid export membrane protein [Inhella inkyongensis]|uniref:O-antigen/teichoic acid export membrane protein n=1 Tax=Inhella inkyongensis TaxID=392593 RepID=A0A840S6E0_9BURK|nr:oligosaccharide flippase family protein [Inhella inkyongensis]MBB5204354.1 O-antigen/teichoic acid export membrane protein [Inhella inkyongensis]